MKHKKVLLPNHNLSICLSSIKFLRSNINDFTGEEIFFFRILKAKVVSHWFH